MPIIAEPDREKKANCKELIEARTKFEFLKKKSTKLFSDLRAEKMATLNVLRNGRKMIANKAVISNTERKTENESLEPIFVLR